MNNVFDPMLAAWLIQRIIGSNPEIWIMEEYQKTKTEIFW
jgi:hypothetical protein